VKSIMLNSGGPLAAQTVYPILDRNHDNLGLSIAVRPSEVTVESMKAMFRVTPQGLQRPWPEGAHQQAEVALKAEQFCLGCHVKAQVGDVLGTVAVRSYLARKEAVWWQEVRLTAGALSLKILAHTVVLLLLLKVRMEPMLSLRGTVGGLAKGVMDLGPRARVKTEDEFGELAQDLNHFLDRIALVVRDLDTILSEVISVGERLGSVAGHALVEALIVPRASTPSFGVPGESYLAVLDGLHEHRDRIRFIACRQEGGAAFMADAQGKLTAAPACAS
jgi:hypothetical protein